MNNDELVEEAKNAMQKSYSPYSKFRVGAALICEDDVLYTGTNIENISYGATICAERVAIFKAVSNGHRIIKKIAVISDLKNVIFPCGMCIQVMLEFANNETDIICAKSSREYRIYKIGDLAPHAFRNE
jgi:cytidine deaminase